MAETTKTYTAEQFISDTADILVEEFGMRDYNAEDFKQAANGEHFSEFWFAGEPHGSFKVLPNHIQGFVVYDQNRVKKNIPTVLRANARIAELVKRF